MNLRNLFLIVLPIALLCPAYTNARSNSRKERPRRARAQQRTTPKTRYGKTNHAEFDLGYKFSVSGNTSKIRLVVALPKTTPSRQKIDIKYSHEPSRIFSKYGNNYAEFIFVEPQKQFEVIINVKAKLFKYDLSTAKARYKENPPQDPNLSIFLRHEKYIEKDDLVIQQIAKSIKGLNETQIIRNIYNYVIDNMHYTGYNQQANGALDAAQRGKGDCTEYATFFAALCRAKNIPARVISGYTTNSTVTPHHNWTEVYFKRYGWVPFDPSRGDTKDASAGKKRYLTLQPVYVYRSHMLNDAVLGNGTYYSWHCWGQKIHVEDSFKFK
jgi:transglutaminase-like putative cysteine protease